MVGSRALALALAIVASLSAGCSGECVQSSIGVHWTVENLVANLESTDTQLFSTASGECAATRIPEGDVTICEFADQTSYDLHVAEEEAAGRQVRLAPPNLAVSSPDGDSALDSVMEVVDAPLTPRC